jgi:hypothetical protein
VASCSNCGDQFPSARRNLGYRTCLPCGDTVARSIRWLSAPINKSNYMLISNPAELAQLNPKRTGG